MSKGIRKYDVKQRRAMRRRNHIARDLWTPEFRPRRTEKTKEYDNWVDDLEEYLDEQRSKHVQEQGEHGGGDPS